ncbi:MAG: type II toxin-antitoxin system VapC family toxin [Ignavibacteriales bacterium]|nr:type II toxin-antitoxin system VapC family toxin [Ignavibacteriales bacterium]
MKLVDSNIIIYSAKTEFAFIRELFKEEKIFASEISRLEVMGYPKITEEQILYFSAVFSLITIIPVNSFVIDEAIILRRKYNLSVGDAIISATASIKNLILITNNTKDFEKVKEIELNNPLLIG